MASNENQPALDNQSRSPSASPIEGNPSAKRNIPPLIGFARYSFNAFNAKGQRPVHPSSPWPPPFRRELFFFYGTLMDPSTLKKVLDLEERPILYSAANLGYHCEMRGPYPALLGGPGDARVEGVAFEVQTADQVKRLQEYETKRYRNAACIIRPQDGQKINGKTFVWNSNEEELREGCFDLKDFRMKQLEMGWTGDHNSSGENNSQMAIQRHLVAV